MGGMTDLTAMQAAGGMGDDPLSVFGPSFAFNYAGLVFFHFGSLVVDLFNYAMIRLYIEREERLEWNSL